MSSAPADLYRLSPAAARRAAVDAFGDRLRSWILRGGARFTDVAAGLGLDRRRLYEAMDGDRRFAAAWLELLPPSVLREALQDLAGPLGLELVPVAQEGEEHDDGRTLADLVRELGDVLRVASESHVDGFLSPDEARAELDEIAEAEVVLARRRARLREVLEERGAPVRRLVGAHRGGGAA